jgi:Trk K+ transport system NAD-binding subunit
MNIIVIGPSRGLVEAFEAEGATVSVVGGIATRDELESVGVADADAVVFTDVEEASAVPVARKLNPDVRIVVYDHETMPEFVRPSVDLAVDPDLLDPSIVAEEIVAG